MDLCGRGGLAAASPIQCIQSSLYTESNANDWASCENEDSLWTKEQIWTAFRTLISRARKQDLEYVIDDLDECSSAKWHVEQFVWLQVESGISSGLVISTRRCFVDDTIGREKCAGRLIKLDLELDMDGIDD